MKISYFLMVFFFFYLFYAPCSFILKNNIFLFWRPNHKILKKQRGGRCFLLTTEQMCYTNKENKRHSTNWAMVIVQRFVFEKVRWSMCDENDCRTGKSRSKVFRNKA